MCNGEDGSEKMGINPSWCQDGEESRLSKDAGGRKARLCFHAPWGDF